MHRSLLIRLGYGLPIEFNHRSRRACPARIICPNVATMLRVWLAYRDTPTSQDAFDNAVHFDPRTLKDPGTRAELQRLLQSSEFANQHLEVDDLDTPSASVIYPKGPFVHASVVRSLRMAETAYAADNDDLTTVRVIPGHGDWFNPRFYGHYAVSKRWPYKPDLALTLHRLRDDHNRNRTRATDAISEDADFSDQLSDEPADSSADETQPPTRTTRAQTSRHPTQKKQPAKRHSTVDDDAEFLFGTQETEHDADRPRRYETRQSSKFNLPARFTRSAVTAQLPTPSEDAELTYQAVSTELYETPSSNTKAAKKAHYTHRVEHESIDVDALPEPSPTRPARPTPQDGSAPDLQRLDILAVFPHYNCGTYDPLCDTPNSTCTVTGTSLRRDLHLLRTDSIEIPAPFTCHYDACGQHHRTHECRREFPTTWHTAFNGRTSTGALDQLCTICEASGHILTNCPLLHGQFASARQLLHSTDVWTTFLLNAPTRYAKKDSANISYRSSLPYIPIRDELIIDHADPSWPALPIPPADTATAGYFDAFADTLVRSPDLIHDVERHFETTLEYLTRQREHIFRAQQEVGDLHFLTHVETLAYYYAIRGVLEGAFHEFPHALQKTVRTQLKSAGYAKPQPTDRFRFWVTPDGSALHWLRFPSTDAQAPEGCRQFRSEYGGAMLHVPSISALTQLTAKHRILCMGSPHQQVSYLSELTRNRHDYEAYLANELHLDTSYSSYAFYITTDTTPQDVVVRDKLPILAHTLRRRLERLTIVALLPTVLSHAGQWLIERRYDDLRDFLDFTMAQVNSVRLGYVAGELFTDFAACTIAQSSVSRQPVAIRYRRNDGTVLSIQLAYDIHQITQDEFNLASRHQSELDAYVLRAYRIGDAVTCGRLLQEYVCPYEKLATTVPPTIYQAKIQWLRQTYPDECEPTPTSELLVEPTTESTPTTDTSSSAQSTDTVQLVIDDSNKTTADTTPDAAQPP
jgi:hypothetical protein